jgi:hypothetical protein
MHRILLRKSQSISPKQVFLASGCEMAFRYLRSRLQLFSGHFRTLRRPFGLGDSWPWWRANLEELRTQLMRLPGGENGCGSGAGTGSPPSEWKQAGSLCEGLRWACLGCRAGSERRGRRGVAGGRARGVFCVDGTKGPRGELVAGRRARGRYLSAPGRGT